MSPIVPERRRRGGARAVALGLALASVLACAPAETGSDTGDEARTYTVRGVVRAAEGELTVQHEAIPDFIGPGGDPEPMHAMTMSFPVADGIELRTLQLGVPIELVLRVDWQADPPALVTGVRPLPDDTDLELVH